MTRNVGVLLAIAACLAFVQQTRAGDCSSPSGCCVAERGCGTPDCCAACGGCRPCQKKVCHVVCDVKTVTKYCWCVECEEFCTPLPGYGPLAHMWAVYWDRCRERERVLLAELR